MIDNLTNISQKGILTIFFSNEKGSLPMIICPENRHISQARLPLLKSVENLTISGDGNYLPGNELTRSLKGNFCSMLKTTATGNFHTNNGYRLDIVIRNNLCQLIGIVYVIEFGAANQGDLADGLPGLFRRQQLSQSAAIRSLAPS